MEGEKQKLGILSLKDGESWTWCEGDIAKAEIWLKHGTLFVFEVSLCGGCHFEAAFCKGGVDALIELVNSWA